MPNKIHIGTGQILEGQNATIMHRLYTPDGAKLTQTTANGSNVTLNVFEIGQPSRGDVAVATITVAISASVFDAFQTDAYWDLDGTGYNFRHMVPYHTAHVDGGSGKVNYRGGRKYRHEYQVATDSFGTMYWVSEIEVVSLSSL